MSTVQKKLDNLIEVVFVKHMPGWARPNHFTAGRFVMIPVVLYLIASGMFSLAFIGFVFAALLDVIDGTLARQRNQITAMGQFLDPMADKGLIFLSLIFLAYYYPFPVLPLLAAILEVVAIGLSAIVFLASRSKHTLPATWSGKLKMVSQVVAVLVILVALTFSWQWLSLVAAVILLTSIVLEIVSFVIYETQLIRHS